ncbi:MULTISPECIES: helix-turn-helix transcriptional regulator [Clostridium]|uniref:HTH-type transcriptional regulator SinR n=2 Tax=Clostridium TaxID=1485 RepID=D8GK12_CLOLD|nr:MULTISPECIES: helix-turn-helix domain-containing protein [Clostridium]ADK13130.1 putative DNA binding protein [Clostridium ljungdahlii DSM 13528]AGY76353.1 helix-turn-helix domain-containing protein [Clostridium autoethanogenum DSM 10061]ALU36516.1 Transcriptional regulator XRE family [Clostridium autoethanogenum DSM 10061]OAA84368.1 HTH-type transcriptional regulator SinR [Clostridium ljungdahlii DSM 13528]OVY48602.1 HTH-type transcriptional regulator SinR [Clostridium autoethanogenum]
MGLKIKLKRIERGIKQYELANKVGISRYYMQLLEKGKAKNPSIAVMKAISKELDMPVQDLFFNDEEE